jgi:hypothetical protein
MIVQCDRLVYICVERIRVQCIPMAMSNIKIRSNAFHLMQTKQDEEKVP